LYQGADFEGLSVHPRTQILYATEGQPQSRLYTVDGETGDIALIGNLNADNAVALAFHPETADLHCWSDQGLLKLDLHTGASTLIWPQSQAEKQFFQTTGPKAIQGLTWNQDGTKLYATADDQPDASSLWEYDNNGWHIACDGLPKKVEGLETVPDGRLVYGFHQDTHLGIHFYDANSCQTLSASQINTPYNDIEGLAWPTQACTPSNQNALKAYFQNVDGFEAVDIQADGRIHLTLNGENHQLQLNNQITPGTPPADSQIQVTLVDDQNGDGLEDYQITYPSGDQQTLYYQGIIEEPPPDDECKTLQAPAIDPTVVSIPALVTQFIYTGGNPIQTGVAADTISLKRSATLRGSVTSVSGEPLFNAHITIKDHPEYGQTVTTCDGSFTMVVNGGAQLTVNYYKDGYLPIQRQIKPKWQQYAWLDEVALTALDSQVTTIDLNANVPIQVAQGSPVTDEDGSRQAVVLFPQGLTATMTLPDGSTQPLTELAVRATEYTVGENGPKAMPAPLPPATAYTYAVELSVDQAIAAGATRVDFSQPVPLYVDNFLNFPVGGIVPIGWYDRTKGAWIASDNGRVIQIISINNGLAILDVEGSGQAASASALSELSISDAERQQLATLYTPGKSLWRGLIPHFTPWDLNWPYGLPEDAEKPSPEKAKTPDDENPDDPCEQAGCIIEAENQVLGESIAITGTPFSLNYRSNRVPGRKAPYVLEIPLKAQGHSIPGSLKRIDLRIDIAGQEMRQSFSPATRSTTFIWNGKDSFGRRLQGHQEAKVSIGYRYESVYYASRSDVRQSFARAGVRPMRIPTRLNVTLSTGYSKQLGTWYPVGAGLGSSTLNIHHAYDLTRKVLYQGNGRQRVEATAIVSGIMKTVAGNGRSYSSSGDGGSATQATIGPVSDIKFGPDGSLYLAVGQQSRIRRVSPEGIITTVAGGGKTKFNGQDIPATEADLSWPRYIALGQEGELYVADSDRVFRIGPDGIIRTVAGNGRSFNYYPIEADDIGDGGPATQAFLDPSGIAFGPDGSLYIADCNHHRIRRVGTDGIIDTVAGLNRSGFSGDGGPATQAKLSCPVYIAFGPDDSLYFSEQNNHRIRRITVDGIISTVAGDGRDKFSGDGGPATKARFWSPRNLAVAPDGSLYIKDGTRIRHVNSNGIISTLNSSGNTYHCNNPPEGLLVTELPQINALAFSPEGKLYIGTDYCYTVVEVVPPFPNFSFGNIFISSENGALLYEFDPSGRHLRTLDTLTGKTVYTFSYTENGYLDEIKDLDGDITRIERKGDTPVAIIAQDGQRTALSLDDNGYLNAITNPAGESTQLNYTEEGLLTQFINPRGYQSSYRYDELGRLEEDTDAAGGGWTLARVEDSDGGYTTTMTSAEGRLTSYKVKSQSNGEIWRVNTAPDGSQVQSLKKTDSTTTITRSDGTVIVSQKGPDPRFGMQAPLTSLLTLTTPSGLSKVVTFEKTVKLAKTVDPLSLLSLTTEITTNDRTSQSVYDATHKTLTAQSAAGRKSVSIFDDKGRVIQEQVPGLVDVFYTYDNRGRLTQVIEGEGDEARTTTLSYDGKGYLDKLTDAVGRYAQFHYDAVGRVTTQILPDGRQINYSYDANGNVTAITPPSRPAHDFEYTKVDLQKQYTPPTLTGLEQPQTQYAYNLDKQLLKIQRPDGQVIDFVYDEEKKRLNRINLPGEQSVSYAYDDSTGKLKTLTAPDGSTLSYTYDGSLPLSETWSNGEITGTLSLSYDNHFQVTTLSVNGNAVNYRYDADGQISKAGDLELTRNEQNGLFTGTQLGNLSTQRTHNTFSEMASETASYNSNTLYRTEYQRDQLGRITQKLETLDGIATTFNYRYDVAGRLIEVKQDAVVVEAYTYDDNGNRLSADTTQGSVKGQYDDQDRLTQYGDNTYDYTENGELRRKNSNGQITQYHYDVFGNLRQVQLADGEQIEYVIDGRNRRIGKKVNGQLVQGFLYQGSLNPVAQLDANGNVISRFVYGSKANVPDYMLKNGKTYRILSDHLGSPRLVVDINEGSIVQRMDYDAFGNVVFDSNPGFQPFGFAGGIYDLDTQLTRFGARDYDAQTGRWTAKDPIGFNGGDFNLYGYVLADPVNWVDLDGLMGELPPGESPGSVGNPINNQGGGGLKGPGTSSPGKTGSPISGPYETPRTPMERMINRGLNLGFSSKTGYLLKICPKNGAIVANPLGVLFWGLVWSPELGCAELECD